jgi:serine/threonine protein kinase
MQRSVPSPGLDSKLSTRAEPGGPAMEGGIEGPSYRSVDVWRIGQYTVLRRLGEGGMGEVFAAYNEGLDRKVAIKILRSNLRRGTEAAARVLREAQAQARLSHPNVVQVYEVGKADGQTFIAMEYIAGQDGRAWLGARRRRWQETLAVFVQGGQGLAAAHRAGLVHRDFKPEQSRLPPKASPSAKRRGSPPIGAFEREAVCPGVVRSGQDGPKLAQNEARSCHVTSVA